MCVSFLPVSFLNRPTPLRHVLCSGAVMKTAALRELIQRAHQHEAQSANLANQLEGKIADLHRAIRLPASDEKGALTRFVAAYIDQVPDILDAANQVAREAGIEEQIKPVLKVAEEF